LGNEERRTLLAMARQTVTAYLKGEKLPDVDPGKLTPMLRAKGACFVTLENRGQLRGCVGAMVATEPLYQAVRRYATEACRDRRFVDNPVTASELDQLHIEISYLTPMKEVADPNEIVVGRDGLMISTRFQGGVLLPQVAARRGWTREQFLAQTCRKAGLPLDAWKKPGTKIQAFQAEVFSEQAPKKKGGTGDD
jgi:AmmeMemoRadiSam system protein A